MIDPRSCLHDFAMLGRPPEPFACRHCGILFRRLWELHQHSWHAQQARREAAAEQAAQAQRRQARHRQKGQNRR